MAASSSERSLRNGVMSAVPQPWNIGFTSLLLIYPLGKQYVGEFEHALFADNPLCSFQGAACEAFAAARGMTERDGVGRRIEADFMRPRMPARATAAHIDGARIPGVAHVV